MSDLQLEQPEHVPGYTGHPVPYPESVHNTDGSELSMVRIGSDKYLLIRQGEGTFPEGFQGESWSEENQAWMLCELSAENAAAIRAHFDFARPRLMGKADSYGFGDRLGNAGAAHLASLNGSHFRPVLAQQSIRELTRTNRTPTDVIDAATWAVFERGYHEGYGADGDHLKNEADIDLMMEAGYTMLTIDPSDHVVNQAKKMSNKELETAFQTLPWDDLGESPEAWLDRILSLQVELENGYDLTFEERAVKESMVKYGRVITHTRQLVSHLESAWPNRQVELELSVDETDEPTTLTEHYLIASELDRLGVRLISLAPRFCGDFEKGIDYKGDLDQFREEYIQHLAIASRFGGYKLSIHSGSDKFAIYHVIGALRKGAVHVKTAGTSYLEALRTVAASNPELFREILAFSRGRFDEDRKTYHISARTEKVPEPESLSDDTLVGLLDDDDARQVLHVTYGSVLSGEHPGSEKFREKIMQTLAENESLYNHYLIRHFHKHLDPFETEAPTGS
ncbi:MAG: tagaturonate epimerase family protein [Bacteroidota bacterium]